MFLSVFDMFKIGIGPSSSHTMGPMVAANMFLDEIRTTQGVLALDVSLHGSLAFTGVGHGTGRAVVLGLCGTTPDTADPDRMEETIAAVEEAGRVVPPSHPTYRFRPSLDVRYDQSTRLPGHPNGMIFTAYGADGEVAVRRTYYSIGGGFVVADGRPATPASTSEGAVPFPFANAAQMLSMARQSGRSIAQMKRANEETRLGPLELDHRLDQIWSAMSGCIDRGLNAAGSLPGALGVRRRARDAHEQLVEQQRHNRIGMLSGNEWLSVYAMAVNEENAVGGRVVTAPTNGAAGVIPSVLKYYAVFAPDSSRASLRDMLLTAAAVGGIIKANASISGAEVGCQGEVGSASAMAAAAYCAAQGGSPAQVENAAEIALEHHLGMTCDPIAGLVQIPCIERNAFGAIKAVAAASLALRGDGTHKVSLDACIETMRQTGRDMHERYKETSLGGLAVNVVEC